MKSILIIRPGAIGDALLSFPVLKALREHYVGAHIVLVSNALVLPLAWSSSVAEQAFDFQDTRWSELFSTTGIHSSFIRDLVEQADLAVCWLRDLDGIVEDNLKAAGVKQVITAPGRPSEGERMHIVDYLAHTVGLHDVMSQSSTLSSLSNVSPTSKVLTNRYVAIHPGSGSAQKCWPVSRFASVIQRLWERNQPVLLLAGPADTELVADLLQRLSPSPSQELFKLLLHAPLLEVAQHLLHCRCYLGNDSGITHLAAMLGIPTVAIFGPTDPVIWRPVGTSVKVIHERTLEHIRVNAVMQAII
jgi:heptosyltransferase III